MEKERLDILLVEKGLFESREKCKSAIMAGVVLINGIREDKPGTKVPVDCRIEIKENINPFVSRGGLKLAKAIKEFGIVLENKACMDIGASTGGFTDCMLKNGAARVVSIDVGYGQLAWELRNDSRVVCMERTNVRYVKPEDIGFSSDFASIDVSFISLTKVMPAVLELLKEDAELVCLIKPQFEAGREKVGKHGVVRDREVHKEVILNIINFVLARNLYVEELSFSPITGPEGNIEYLLYISKQSEENTGKDIDKLIDRVVSEAHVSLVKN
ncbi:23S rRNA (cytidine1920-2'-O)/16S rRNA (cytidine1409-2'-O)-methyltransferase [Ruminiclostridium sufflavum DSM 19573]|uniref:23S rRNA (Cytidine1920-2'-O)/16S rRNA (Cytidine1409-2'-O)-methyltransferase n=1 Tax=Ruminiclostridium sufflavum DSM 19573 TaxID=1121337 RepID=A0A318XJW7_9FIRM|nr:TlyA family RNA methyltransferase [Ruminiclostridium sufflavum]PYG86826.1 23S rRNA (cytidine1920-2'-O)/16S rRNA (cytidine1409-2'-O)-methyltransferase [Ruminiclostridium sufflavum DSM 19573]